MKKSADAGCHLCIIIRFVLFERTAIGSDHAEWLAISTSDQLILSMLPFRPGAIPYTTPSHSLWLHHRDVHYELSCEHYLPDQ